MTSTQQQEFAQVATKFHRSIVTQMRDLNPTDLRYRQLLSLTGEVVRTIDEITGKEPVWTRFVPSR